MEKTILILTGILVFCATLVLLADSAIAVTLPFVDDFENITVGSYPSANGWSVLFSGKSAYVSDAVANSGTKSFRLDSYPNWAHMDYVYLDEVPDRLTYEVSIYVDPSQGRYSYVGFMKGMANYGGTWNRFQVMGAAGEVRFVGAPGTNVYCGSYNPGTWCTVRADLDFVNLVARLWLDGQPVASDVAIRPKEFDDPLMGHVVMDKWGVVSTNYSGGTTNVVYFDDVRIRESSLLVDDILPVPFQPQGGTMWCGLCSLAMVGCYFDAAHVTSWPVYGWELAEPGRFDRSRDQGIILAPLGAPLIIDSALGLGAYVDVQTWNPPDQSTGELLKHIAGSIKSRSPVVFSYPEAGIKHIVVIAGIKYDESNPESTVLYVNDPGQGQFARSISYEEFEDIYKYSSWPLPNYFTVKFNLDSTSDMLGLLDVGDYMVSFWDLAGKVCESWCDRGLGLRFENRNDHKDDIGYFVTTGDYIDIQPSLSNHTKQQQEYYLKGDVVLTSTSEVSLSESGGHRFSSQTYGPWPDPLRIDLSPLRVSSAGTDFYLKLSLLDSDGNLINSVGDNSELSFRVKPVQAVVDAKPENISRRALTHMKFVTCHIEIPTSIASAGDIDVDSLMVNDISAVEPEQRQPEPEDYDNDGIPDIMVRIRVGELDVPGIFDALILTVSGFLNDETQFEGTDFIWLK